MAKSSTGSSNAPSGRKAKPCPPCPIRAAIDAARAQQAQPAQDPFGPALTDPDVLQLSRAAAGWCRCKTRQPLPAPPSLLPPIF